MNYVFKGVLKMKMFVFIDGEKIKEVEIDIKNESDIKRVLEKEFDCEIESEEDYDFSFDDGEFYIGISECEYLWCDLNVVE